MRLGLIGGIFAMFAAAGCNQGADEGAATNADSGLTAEAITANDVTAIDAVTGAAANMAADVDYRNLTEDDGNATGNVADERAGARREARPDRRAGEPETDPAPAPEPANSAE